jgi:hypothetical protein
MRTLPAVAIFLLASALAAQSIPVELAVNNWFRVVGGRHSQTNNYMPATGTVPPEYFLTTGVPAGTRTYTYTPPLRAQGNSQGTHAWTVTGMTMAIFVGPAVTTFPAPNHYQPAAGVAPSVATTPAPIRMHAPDAADVLAIATAPLAVTQWNILEHSVTLATPVVLPLGTELLLWLEYRGGEYLHDPNGGQCIASDFNGGGGPGEYKYQGNTYGPRPRTVTPYVAGYRPKIGLLVDEPVVTATGFHASNYYRTPNPPEHYRGLSACYADWSNSGFGSLFFDVRAGDRYASGYAVVLLNVGTFFQNRIPLPWGNLMLQPADPALGVVAGTTLSLTAGGTYDAGPTAPIPVPALGRSAVGTVLKAQALVFNQGFLDSKLTSASAIQVF